METPVPDSVSAVQNVTNATRDVESEFETGQEGKIREIVMDNIDAEPKVSIVVLFLTSINIFLIIIPWLINEKYILLTNEIGTNWYILSI